MKYRSDVDGLRALAVIPVVLFHYGFESIKGISLVGGGFVGVDVFFVISGFLISRILFEDISSGSYSIVDFYTRRIRRIFPVLVVVFIFCLIGSLFSSVGDEAVEIRNSMLSAVFFVSNVFFSAKDGYFATNLQINPVLHTWSLSVEEQFYIVFPLVLYWIRNFSSIGRLTVLSVLTVISLAYSEYLVRVHPDEAYYSFFARMWELSLGSILAVSTLPKCSRITGELLSIVGILLLLACFIGYDKNTPFPGVFAVVPCLGAMCIIYSGASFQTLAGKFLGWTPIRFTGLISYSLYLWHWPLMVFFKLNFRAEGKLAAFFLFILAYLISVISWKYVETPFRKIKVSSDRFVFIKWGALAMVCLSFLSALSVPLVSVLRPQTETTKKFQEAMNYKASESMRSGVCFLTSKFSSIAYFQPDVCLDIKKNMANYLIIGDSHSAQYWISFRNAFPGANVMQASASGCLPNFRNVGKDYCLSMWDYIFNDFLPGKRLDAIILSARWKKNSIKDAIEVAEELALYADKVIILGPNQEYSLDLPRLLIKAEYAGNMAVLDQYISTDVIDVDVEFRKINFPKPVVYISFFDEMCHPMCPITTEDGYPTLFDSNHLTETAARQFISKIKHHFH